MKKKLMTVQFLKLFVFTVIIFLLQPGTELSAGEYDAQPMKPNPPEKCEKAGLTEGMSLFPSKPVPGQPGVDPAVKDRAWIWAYPERLNYPGSVEHYRIDNQKYIKPVNRFNHRTLIKNFIAAKMKGVSKDRIESFAEPIGYVRKGHNPQVLYSGKTRPPVQVVRLKPGGKRLSFNIGPLPTSFYVVRIIGAMQREDATLGKPKKDLIVDMKINDGPNGEINHYVMRQHGADNFYSLGEFFFHVEDKRKFNISIGVHRDSMADLMVYNVDVHDALAECARRAGKTKSIMVNVAEMKKSWLRPESKKSQKREKQKIERELKILRKEFSDKNDTALLKIRRDRRDDVLWYSMIPLNSQYAVLAPNVPSAPDAKTAAILKASKRTLDDAIFGFGYGGYKKNKFWRFDLPDMRYGINWNSAWRLIWEKEDGTTEYYTREDFKNQKPLPGLPFDVPPWGKRFETDKGPTWLYPQIQGISTAYYKIRMFFIQADRHITKPYNEQGLLDVARDSAMMLCSYAYNLPSNIESHAIGYALSGPFVNRLPSHQHRRRNYQCDDYNKVVEFYDRLFPFIKDNQELATAVGKYVKWVKKPKDVIALLDTYLVQFAAKEALYMRYYYNYGHAGFLSQFAAIQGDQEISKPWIKAAYNRSWEYPARSYVGVQDLIYYTVQRDGTTNIGSFSYAHGAASATLAADWIDKWIDQGGDEKFRLADPKRYPRVTEYPNWLLESRVAGFQDLAIGDVSGPSRAYGLGFVGNMNAWAPKGWAWTKDPRFAYCLVNYRGRKSETDKEWQEIENAAKGIRNPMMANRSRILTDWGGILEGGTQSDDFRFRHAIRVRLGFGTAHSHKDTLDLGLWSLGMLLAPDIGARGGYGRPAVKSSHMHNTVTSGNATRDNDFSAHAWTAELADMENVQYLRAISPYGNTLGMHNERQVALVELDKGRAAKKPPSNLDLRPGTKYDPDIVFPRAYFVDFYRKEGGQIHKYNFHGPTEDEFKTNLTKEPLSSTEAAWAKKIRYVVKDEQWAADINKDVFTATWRMGREPITFNAAERGERVTRAPEPSILGPAYDKNSPRKYIKLHMPGQKGRRVVSGVAIAASYHKNRKDGDWLRNIHVVHNVKKNGSSLYAAVFEPYAGKPFIKSVSLEGDVDDMRSMAALHVNTVDGISDINFADMRNAPERTLKDGTLIQGSFAYISRDSKGLRQVNLVNGQKLKIPEVTIEPEQSTWTAKVASIDYFNKTMMLDKILPAGILDGDFFEVGLPRKGKDAEHWTTFKASEISTKGNKSELQWLKGAEVYSGKIISVETMKEARAKAKKERKQFYPNEEDESLFIHLGLAVSLQQGNLDNVVIASEDGKRNGLCTVTGNSLICDPATVPPDMFKAGDRIKLYEIGVGHTIRFTTKTSLIRVGKGNYKLSSNVPLSLTIKGKKRKYSLKDIQKPQTIRIGK